MSDGRISRRRRRLASFSLAANVMRLLILLLTCSITTSSFTAAAQPDDRTREYLIVGVSGGLQDGFPEHNRLDYHSGKKDEVQSIFLGRALVRGYKAFLDVMEPTWRQYTVSKKCIE